MEKHFRQGVWAIGGLYLGAAVLIGWNLVDGGVRVGHPDRLLISLGVGVVWAFVLAVVERNRARSLPLTDHARVRGEVYTIEGRAAALHRLTWIWFVAGLLVAVLLYEVFTNVRSGPAEGISYPALAAALVLGMVVAFVNTRRNARHYRLLPALGDDIPDPVGA